MSKVLVPILAQAIETYYEVDTLTQLFDLFDDKPVVKIVQAQYQLDCFQIAKKLIVEMEQGNNRKLLETIIPDLLTRCDKAIASNTWERQSFHSSMYTKIRQLEPLLEAPGIPTEISVPDNKPFTAKSEFRDFVAKAQTGVLLVDAYIGLQTLDCLADVDLQHPIRILTSSIGPGFDAAAKDFQAEGHKLEVRRHTKLHDRYVIFNDRAWLVGGSIKDAGKKALNVIESIDVKRSIIDDAEDKWKNGTPHP